VHRNAAVSLRDGYRAVASRGVCAEALWPYRPAAFARRPPAACYRAAARAKAIGYFRIHQELRHLKACLAQGLPFTFGGSIHESFMTRQVKHTGRIPMPRRGERVLGGHAMTIVGYEDRRATFILRNSWGTRWGLGGYAELPYDFLLHPSFAWDFWTCTRIGS
jgi:C1A family cysteine protease